MTTYLIAHTPRTGSNFLCELLSKTGEAGIVSLDNCGLFIGSGPDLKQVYPRRMDEFFRRQTTPNGVCGMKSGWGYLDHLDEHIHPGVGEEVLSRFTHFIHLKRDDVYAQCVSAYVATVTAQFSSRAKHPPKVKLEDVSYDFDALYDRYQRFTKAQARWDDWFDTHKVPVYDLTYETLVKRTVTEVRQIFDFLGMKSPKRISTDTEHQKQTLYLKDEYAQRFKSDLIERGLIERE